MEEEKLFTRKEAAAYLGGICLTTLSRLSILQVKIRRRVFYRREDLQKWLSRHVFKTEEKI
jgi:hypothetical protein